jgi:hypothetical protein
MKAQGIPDFQAPPPIPKFIDTVEAIDELPAYAAIHFAVLSHGHFDGPYKVLVTRVAERKAVGE